MSPGAARVVEVLALPSSQRSRPTFFTKDDCFEEACCGKTGMIVPGDDVG